MKRMLVLAVAAVLVLLSGCSMRRAREESGAESTAVSRPVSEPEPVPEPDSATPQGAVAELFEGAKGWDADAMGSYLPEGINLQTYLPPELQGCVRQLLDRMEYTVGAAAIDGDRAVVQVTVTAADAESAVNDAIATAAATVIKGKLTGKELNYLEVAGTAIAAIDIAALPDKTTTVDAYMVRDGEQWKLDIANKANTPLLNAVSGGAVELYGQFRELAESHGIMPGR